MAVVIHEYALKNMRKLTRNEEADCVSCAFSEKCRTVDGVDEYLCRAALYDTETLSCYVKKSGEEKQDG